MLEILNTNPSIYAYEDENEIDKLIKEIELGNEKVISENAKKILLKLLTD